MSFLLGRWRGSLEGGVDAEHKIVFCSLNNGWVKVVHAVVVQPATRLPQQLLAPRKLGAQLAQGGGGCPQILLRNEWVIANLQPRYQFV
jgi:hypothetical protein